MQLKNHYDTDGVMSFIDDICFIRACGMVDAERMLNCIHMFSTKPERKQAFREYNEWKKNRIFTHQVTDENGNPEQAECTMYFKHVDNVRKRQQICESL